MTIVETILQRAKAYPDRPAIVTADGAVTLYGDLAKTLVSVDARQHRTSGTTSSAKLVTVTDADQVKRLARFDRVYGPTFAALTSLFAPIIQSAALTSSPPLVSTQIKLSMLLKGGTLYSGDTIDPAAWLDMCARHSVAGIAFFPKVPYYWKLLDLEHSYRFAHVAVGGGPMAREDMDQIVAGLGADVHFHYGVTEVGPVAGGPYEMVKDIPGCVGLVDPDVNVGIVDGQVRIRCDTMVAGYDDDPALTAQRFKGGGWFYPGDLGHFEKGMLVIDGRA